MVGLAIRAIASKGMSASGFRFRQMRVWTTRDTVGLATGAIAATGTNVYREGHQPDDA
jgi:hypothetical protein